EQWPCRKWRRRPISFEFFFFFPSCWWSNRGLKLAPRGCAILRNLRCPQLLRQASSISTHKEKTSKGNMCTLCDGNRPQSVHHVFKILRLHNERLFMLSPMTEAQFSSVRCFVGQLAIAP
ncbi:unnamed protein product, partial [Ectocarpus sp. 8 AP-2014]